MEKGKIITEVIFKKDKRDNTITAFFPYEPANRGNILCYEHIGQHAEAGYDYYYSCQKAKPEEYKSLFNELENIVGYNLKVIQKINHKRV